MINFYSIQKFSSINFKRNGNENQFNNKRRLQIHFLFGSEYDIEQNSYISHITIFDKNMYMLIQITYLYVYAIASCKEHAYIVHLVVLAMNISLKTFKELTYIVQV